MAHVYNFWKILSFYLLLLFPSISSHYPPPSYFISSELLQKYNPKPPTNPELLWSIPGKTHPLNQPSILLSISLLCSLILGVVTSRKIALLSTTLFQYIHCGLFVEDKTSCSLPLFVASPASNTHMYTINSFFLPPLPFTVLFYTWKISYLLPPSCFSSSIFHIFLRYCLLSHPFILTTHFTVAHSCKKASS